MEEKKLGEINGDDLYLIEQVMDVYAGWISDNLVRACDTALKYDGYKAATKSEGEDSPDENPLDKSIIALQEAYDKVKAVRVKLENMRKEGD